MKRFNLRMFAIATMGTLLSMPGVAAIIGGTTGDWGLINVSACNMRVKADYDAGMATQALLGMPVRIIEDGTWMHVETPEGYQSWVHNRTVHRITREQLTEWNSKPMLVVTALCTTVYSEPRRKSLPVSDVVACDRLVYLGKRGNYYKVAYPDGRIGYIQRNDGEVVSTWRKNLSYKAEDILESAKTMIGIPYMWGGMSTKGVDCSGFVRTVLLMHDIILPRDAWQMATKGKHIDIAPDFSNLEPGDLIFFGRKATMTEDAHVSHVAFYLGNKKFIHSLGMVQIASFDPKDSDYDEYDLNRLLWAQRVLPYINKVPQMFTTDNCEFYK